MAKSFAGQDKTDVAAYSNLAAALLAVSRPGAAALAGVQAVHEMLHGHVDEKTEDAGALKQWRVLCKAAYRGSIGLSWCGQVAAGARLAEFASAAARVASSGGTDFKDIAFESQSKETVRAAAAAWSVLRESSRSAGDGSADGASTAGGPTGTGGGIHTVLMRAAVALTLGATEFKGPAVSTRPKAEAASSSASASGEGGASRAAGESKGGLASKAAPAGPLLRPGMDDLREARCTALRLERAAAAAAAPPAGKSAPPAQFKSRSASLEACIGSAWLAGGMASVAVERLEEALARWGDHEKGERAAVQLEEALAPAVQREMIGRRERDSAVHPEGWKGGRCSLEVMRAVCDCALGDHSGAVERLQRVPWGSGGVPQGGGRGSSAAVGGAGTTAPLTAASSGAAPEGVGALIAHLQAVIAEKARLGSRFKEASGAKGGDNASMREVAEGYAALEALMPVAVGDGPGAGAGPGADAAGWQSALLDALRCGAPCASFGCNRSVALLRAGDEEGALRAAVGVCRRHPLSERGWHRLANAAAARLAGQGAEGGKGPAGGASVAAMPQSPAQTRALLCSAVDVLGCLDDYTAPAAGSLPLGKGRSSWLAEGVKGEASRRALGKDLAKGRALVTRGGTPAVREVPSDGHFSSVAAAAAATGAVLVVDYHATWCGPCKMLAPHYQALASRLSGPRCQFLKVDGDVCQRTVATAGVSAFPTVHGYWPPSGTRLAELQGADPSALQRVVKEAIERGRAARAKVLSRARAAGEGGAGPLSKADAEGAKVAGPALADAALVQAVKGALEAATSMGM